jgi:hypothetical protein
VFKKKEKRGFRMNSKEYHLNGIANNEAIKTEKSSQQ